VERLTERYGHRTTAEELFRDNKNSRSGWWLSYMPITKVERVNRLLLILAFASWLLVGLGLVARHRYCPWMWCRGIRVWECRVFSFGEVPRERMED